VADPWTITINGTNHKHDVMSGAPPVITMPLNERATCRFTTRSGFVPARFDDVLITYDGVNPFFRGVVLKRSIVGVSAGLYPYLTQVECGDYGAAADWCFATLDYTGAGSAPTLSQVLTDLVGTQLSSFGISVDPSQSTFPNPTLDKFAWKDKRVSDCLRELCDKTGSVFRVGAYKTIAIFPPGNVAAPYIISDASPHCSDLVWSDTDKIPANNIILSCGQPGSWALQDYNSVVANGTATSWTFHGPGVGSYPYTGAGGGSSIDVGGVNLNVTPGIDQYHWAPSTATLSVGSYGGGAPPAAGTLIQFMRNFDYPLIVRASAGTTPVITFLATAPDVTTWQAGQALADALLAEMNQQPRIARVLSYQAGWGPGQLLTIALSGRGSFNALITDVTITLKQTRDATLWIYNFNAQENTKYQGSILDNWRGMLGSGGSSSTVISGGGGGGGGSASIGPGTTGRLSKWITPSTIGDSLLSESGSTITSAGAVSAPSFASTGSGFSGSGAGLTNLPSTALTGTIPVARFPALTGGDVTSAAGSGNLQLAAGAIVDGDVSSSAAIAWSKISKSGASLGDITIGNLAWNQLPSGAGFWAGTPTILGTLQLRQDIFPDFGALAPVNLGRADTMFGKAYIAQLESIRFDLATQTLFGGYSTIGKGAGTFAAAVASTDTSIDFGQTMTLNDWVLVRGVHSAGGTTFEYIQVGSIVSGTRYNVTRDLGSANVPDPGWPQGMPYLLLGHSGDGRIDMLAYDGKPRILFVEQGSTYNAQTLRGTMGNLNGYYGYASDLYGTAFGAEAGSNITIDPTNGFRIRYGSTTYAQMASSVFTLGAAGGNRLTWNGSELAVTSAGLTIDNQGITIAPSTSVPVSDANAYRFKNQGGDTGYFGVYGMENTSASVKRIYVNNWLLTGGGGVASIEFTLGAGLSSGSVLSLETAGAASATTFQFLGAAASFASPIKERGRTTAIGEWTDVPYSSGNFTASSGAWSTLASCQITYAYTLIGKTAIVDFQIDSTNVTAATTYLILTLPSGITPAKTVTTTIQTINAGAGAVAIAAVFASDPHIYFQTQSGASWTITAGANTYVRGTFAIPIT